MQKPFDDFTTQIQSDEVAAKSHDAKFDGGYPGGNWINDFEKPTEDDDDGDIFND